MTPSIHAAAVLVAAVLAGPALADPVETAKAAGSDASWLFIQTAQAVAFDGTTLTLTDVGPSVVMFADRPARVAEAIPTATFLASWDQGGADSFQADPPNAGLTSLVDGKLQGRHGGVEPAPSRRHDPDLSGSRIEGTVPPAAGTSSLFIDRCNPGNPGHC